MSVQGDLAKLKEANKISCYQKGNELDIEEIITQYTGYLFKVIQNKCGNHLASEDIEEIILDVFFAIWKNREKLEEDKDIKPYLASVAHHLTSKKLAQNTKYMEWEELDERTDFSKDDWTQFIENRQKMNNLEDILKGLSQEEYTIFTLFYYHAKKTKEIAKELDISNAKVKTKLHRIRNKIKKKLEKGGCGNG